jgi:4a-hydroxytetrahydrobiopterin dehydratase
MTIDPLYLQQTLPTWTYINNAIEKNFEFVDFNAAFGFMTQVAMHCEVLGHHPEWHNVYNKLTIRLTTHDHAALTNKDIQLALRIDKILQQIKPIQ